MGDLHLKTHCVETFQEACMKGDVSTVKAQLKLGADPHGVICENQKSIMKVTCEIFRKLYFAELHESQNPDIKVEPRIDKDGCYADGRHSENSDPESPVDCETKYKRDIYDTFQMLNENRNMSLRFQNLFFSPSDEEIEQSKRRSRKRKAMVYRYRLPYNRSLPVYRRPLAKCILLRTLKKQDIMEVIKLLLEYSNGEKKEELTQCFYLVAESHCIELVKTFLDAGFDPDDRDKYGNTLLHRVLESPLNKDPHDLVVLLSDRISDINCINNRGFSPLHLAVLNFYTKSVKYFLNEKKAKIHLDSNEEHKIETPLFMVINRQWLNYYKRDRLTMSEESLEKIEELAEILIAAGASLISTKGKTIYHMSFIGRLPKLWNKLHEKYSHFVTQADDNGNTPLHTMYRRNVDMYVPDNEFLLTYVRKLLDCGADIRVKNNESEPVYAYLCTLMTTCQSQMVENMETPGGRIFTERAEPLMHNYIPALTRHMLTFLSAGMELSPIMAGQHIQFQYPFFRLTRIKMFRYYHQVYGQKLRIMYEKHFIINEQQLEVLSEMRSLKLIAAQAVRIACRPNAFYAVKKLGLPSTLTKQICPEPVSREEILEDQIPYKEQVLNWQIMLNY